MQFRSNQHPRLDDSPPSRDESFATARPALPMRASLRRFALETLLGGDKEAEIVHGQCVYRLRLTAQGKLILTK